jgi:DNA-binding response OmpR family regulator
MIAPAKPLIIATDDDFVILELYQAIMQKLFGADVIITIKPGEALRLATRKIPDLFITDLHKRRSTGVTLIERLRSNQRTSTVPIWVISGQANTEFGLRAKRAGADLLIEKPFAIDLLLEHGNRLFNRRRTGRFDHLLDLGTETQDVDYKQELCSTRDAVANVAKDIIAIGNFGGGYLVFGICEKSKGVFSQDGLNEEQLRHLEVTTLNKAVREYIDPPHAVKCYRFEKGERTFVVVEIPPAEKAPLLAKRQHEGAKLYLGRIYTRTTACESAEVRDNHELRRILDRISSAAK